MPSKRTAPAKLTTLDLRQVPLADLKPDPGNARVHNDRNLAAIRASLRRFGQRKPLVVAKDLTVVAGGGTLAVMADLGLDPVWVSVFPGTAAEARAYGIADNRTGELAEWDPQLLTDSLLELSRLDPALLDASGFDTLDLDGLMAAAAPPDLGDALDPPEFRPRAASGGDPDVKTLGFELPAYLFLWAAEQVAEYRDGKNLESNGEALVALLEEATGTPAPDEPSGVTAE